MVTVRTEDGVHPGRAEGEEYERGASTPKPFQAEGPPLQQVSG